ncbi:mechanosensitive ion channel family protein [Pelobacter propionicus]|uniref:MscS Mechanosensitive ion channel n=1 Tax=Pelobacter propionicus (strain DSM 2379 / NBRC 103807 / OttBd1) TaxID=338966 RepID=A1AN50_PELPD|nr:mechanosensitive ion channel family protein [Pelobacter propionicus]ABK98770.1 MscS Mechanosensitive ion channel [Pelobacter propionicus DSM 2379]
MNSGLLTLLQSFLRPQETDGILRVWAKELLVALLILTCFWLLAQAACWILNRWGRRLTTFTRSDLDDRILQRLIPHVSRLLTMLGLYLAMHSLPLNERLVVIFSGLLYVVLVAVFFNLVYHALDELIQWYIAGQRERSDALISRQMLPVAEKLALLLLMGTALIIILKHFNYDIFSVVTALGIGSLAIGLAAKDTLAHMISGFTLMLDRPFRIGDRIQLAGGQTGDVLDIGLRSTKIMTLSNQQLVIPNSELCNSMLTNLAAPDVRAKGRINIGVAYGSDVERVKRVLVDTALAVDDVLADPPPEAFFVAFGDSSLSMALFFWVESYEILFTTTDRINSLILRRFADNAIEIPFPTRTVIMEKGLD